MKKRILVFCNYYLPGIRSGGGMWTVVNLIDRFSHHYDFFVVTRNHDSASNKVPFDSVVTDNWNQIGNARVYYFGKGKLSIRNAAALVKEVGPNALFLNSAFAMPTLRVLWGLRKKIIPPIPVILAPCGELGTGALSLKPLKKRLFLRYANYARLYRGILWKASSSIEEAEIRTVIGTNANVMVAPDLVPSRILPKYDQKRKPRKFPGRARFVVIARIVEKKNIHFFLECLQNVRDGEVTFEIIGPVEEPSYWQRCQKIISELPANITVRHTGPLQQSEAIERAFDSHFFALPSLNENFGYVIIESLAAGTPLIISDQTMWTDLETHGVGWAIPLERRDMYVDKILECVKMDDSRFSLMSAASRSFALHWLADGSADKATEKVLAAATSGVAPI